MLKGPWKGAATLLPACETGDEKKKKGEMEQEWERGEEGIFIKAQIGLLPVTICFVLRSEGL